MIKEVQLRVSPECAGTDKLLRRAVAEEAAIDGRSIKAIRILRRSIDARGRAVMVNLNVRAYVDEEPTDEPFEHTEYLDVSDREPVVVVGAGPGGLFSALRLIELGLRPIVLERGKVAERGVHRKMIRHDGPYSRLLADKTADDDEESNETID
jgi:uncharacterized FAD-dependent dehydrogenase